MGRNSRQSCFRRTLVGALCALSAAGAVTDAAAAKKRRVDELLEKPRDYSSFERRRQENIDRLAAGNGAYFVAFSGRVSALDEPKVSRSEYIDDPEAAAKLKVIIDDLFPDALTAAPNYEIAFLESESFSPFATSAGAIVIPVGFLKQTKSQDALAFVVGHEAGHLLTDDFKSNERKEAINSAAGVAILAAAVASGGGEVGGDSLKAVRAAQALITLNELVLGPSWGRKQELRADELGFDLMMDEGGSPDGVFDLMATRVTQFNESEAALDEFCGKKQSVGGLLLKGVLEEAIGAPGALSEGSNPGHPYCQQRNSLLTRLLASHPDPVKRLEGLTEYQTEFYADIEGIRSQTFYEPNALMALSPNGPLARSSHATDAKAALDAGDVVTAEKLAKKSLSGPTDATPKARYVNYLVQKRKGNRKAAISHLEMVVEDDETTATLEIYIALADEYAADKLFDKALATIEHGKGFYGPGPFLPQRVRFLTALGDVAGANAALTECLALKDSIVEARCRAALAPPEAAAAPQAAAIPAEGATIFARLLREPGGANILALLEGDAPKTLLAPSDNALRRALGADGVEFLLAPRNAAALEAFLAAHVVDGDIPASGVGAKIIVSRTRDALQRPVTLSVEPAHFRTKINGADVLVGDIAGDNGRIHVIGDVLASPETALAPSPQ